MICQYHKSIWYLEGEQPVIANDDLMEEKAHEEPAP